MLVSREFHKENVFRYLYGATVILTKMYRISDRSFETIISVTFKGQQVAKLLRNTCSYYRKGLLPFS